MALGLILCGSFERKWLNTVRQLKEFVMFSDVLRFSLYTPTLENLKHEFLNLKIIYFRLLKLFA